MVTKIEIGKHVQNKIHTEERELIAVLPDAEGEHTLASGEVVSLLFEKDGFFGYRFVRIGVEDLPALQTRKNRKERIVNISNDGKGMIILSGSDALFVSTDAKEEQFRTVERR